MRISYLYLIFLCSLSALQGMEKSDLVETAEESAQATLKCIIKATRSKIANLKSDFGKKETATLSKEIDTIEKQVIQCKKDFALLTALSGHKRNGNFQIHSREQEPSPKKGKIAGQKTSFGTFNQQCYDLLENHACCEKCKTMKQLSTNRRRRFVDHFFSKHIHTTENSGVVCTMQCKQLFKTPAGLSTHLKKRHGLPPDEAANMLKPKFSAILSDFLKKEQAAQAITG